MRLSTYLRRKVLFSLATSTALERAVRSAPAGEAAAWRFARRYVAGRDVDAGLTMAQQLAARGFGTSVDRFGEQVGDAVSAQRVSAEYVDLAGRIRTLPASVWLSVDLSHIGLDVSVHFCRAQLERIAAALPPGRLLQVGAEDSSRTDGVLSVVLAAASAGVPVMATVQANLRRSTVDARRLTDAGVPVRLVKGAYVEPRRVALPWGPATDTAYLRLAHQLHRAGVPFALATHDELVREPLISAFGPTSCELLHGVGTAQVDQLTARGCPVRVYLPCGPNWFRYAMRRLAEARGA